VIRNISDTALWAAVFRGRETDREDALFRDPFARRLAGERGEQIANNVPHAGDNAWAWVMRTYLFDQFITEQIRDGVDLVVNLAAGLDARPYRMALPASLQWVEVDLPDLFDYKEEILAGEKPVCALERVRLNLADVSARRELFSRLGRKVLVLSEGLLVYLSREEVGELARDLSGFERWVIDLVSPALLAYLQAMTGAVAEQAGAPYKFGPPEGPEFFTPHGWKATDVRSIFKAAVETHRVPPELQAMAHLPESPGDGFWSGVCLLAPLAGDQHS
jgi:methyltransferase (TIGR00027 family)